MVLIGTEKLTVWLESPTGTDLKVVIQSSALKMLFFSYWWLLAISGCTFAYIGELLKTLVLAE